MKMGVLSIFFFFFNFIRKPHNFQHISEIELIHFLVLIPLHMSFVSFIVRSSPRDTFFINNLECKIYFFQALRLKHHIHRHFYRTIEKIQLIFFGFQLPLNMFNAHICFPCTIHWMDGISRKGNFQHFFFYFFQFEAPISWDILVILALYYSSFFSVFHQL